MRVGQCGLKILAVDGAVLKGSFWTDRAQSLAATFYRSDGSVDRRLEATQSFAFTEDCGDFHLAPFFCNSNQAGENSVSVYDVDSYRLQVALH